jgi:Ca2+-binding EF-hand superfamily protein
MSKFQNDNIQDNIPISSLTLCTLLNTIHELEEINHLLGRVDSGFDHGEVNFDQFDQAMLQLNDCREQLEEILIAQTNTGFPL